MEKIIWIVSKFKEMKKKNNSGAEFEARLGYYKGNFVTDVGEAFFERVKKLLEESEYVTQTDVVEYHDYIYLHNNIKLRTRVIFDTMGMNMLKQTITKQRIRDVTFKEYGQPELCVRIQLSEENKYIGNLPGVVDTDYVRIVQRYSYTVGSWRYDFSRVSQGKTRMEAEENKRLSNFQHEIECELIDNDYINTKSASHIAKSILHKMTNITNCSWNLSE